MVSFISCVACTKKYTNLKSMSEEEQFTFEQQTTELWQKVNQNVWAWKCSITSEKNIYLLEYQPMKVWPRSGLQIQPRQWVVFESAGYWPSRLSVLESVSCQWPDVQCHLKYRKKLQHLIQNLQKHMTLYTKQNFYKDCIKKQLYVL